MKKSRAATSTCFYTYMNEPCGWGRCDSEGSTERDSAVCMKVRPQACTPSPCAPVYPACAARSDLRSAPPRPHIHSLRPSSGNREPPDTQRRSSRVKFMEPDHSSSQGTDPGYTSPRGCDSLKSLRVRLLEGAMDAYTVPSKSMNKDLRYIYTSEAQSGYKFSPRLKPPLSLADPVRQCSTIKRYHSRPEIWQTLGPHWNRQQIRASYDVKKPFSFTSPCPKSGQIPLYSGVIGSENMDNIDIPGKDFIPLTVLRTIIPPDTPTAYCPTIPGYTGKSPHDRPNTLLTSQPSSVLTYQTTGSRSSSYGQQAPLSRMVTTVPPCNPFLHPKAPTPTTPIYS